MKREDIVQNKEYLARLLRGSVPRPIIRVVTNNQYNAGGTIKTEYSDGRIGTYFWLYSDELSEIEDPVDILKEML